MDDFVTDEREGAGEIRKLFKTLQSSPPHGWGAWTRQRNLDLPDMRERGMAVQEELKTPIR